VGTTKVGDTVTQEPTEATQEPEGSMTLTIPIPRKYDGAIKRAAQGEVRSQAGYIRLLILRDLQERGLVDDNMEPVPQNA